MLGHILPVLWLFYYFYNLLALQNRLLQHLNILFGTTTIALLILHNLILITPIKRLLNLEHIIDLILLFTVLASLDECVVCIIYHVFHIQHVSDVSQNIRFFLIGCFGQVNEFDL